MSRQSVSPPPGAAEHVAYALLWQTAAIMQWFAALIPTYPEIQAKAHAELDAVVGRDRLPTIDDEPRLPYVRVSDFPDLRDGGCLTRSARRSLKK